MSVANLLASIIASLNEAEIPHMVAGSFASTYHGEPRTTQDIDIVIDPTRSALEKFVGGLPVERYYADLDAALDALARRGIFNVVDMDTGWKVDFIVRKQRRFSIEEFSRREPTVMLGIEVFVATAEDTIVAKLEWAREGQSERQLRDVESILAVSGDHLDRAYVEGWVAELGLAELWSRVQGA
jgi:hypothetical protein